MTLPDTRQQFHAPGGKRLTERLFGEHPLSAGFRGYRHVVEFGVMLRAIFRPKDSGDARRSSATPGRYRELVDSLDPPPDRPTPLHDLERAVPGEATMVRNMARIAAEAVVTNFCEMKATDRFAPAMRDQHAKTHGCVAAEFTVRDDLPAEFVTDLFRPGARYRATVRFSNGRGQPYSDRKVDARGLSIKLHGVGAETVLRGLAPDKTVAGEHDFALSSFPIFFCRNVIDYTKLMNAASTPTATWRDKLAFGLRWGSFIVQCPRQFYLFIRTAVDGLLRVRNPLTATYHSMSPYLFGGNTVVRYLVAPPESQNRTPRWTLFELLRQPEGFLRDELVRDLDPRAHRPGDRDSVLEFCVRVRHAATVDDVEDASRWWTRPQDKVVRLATIKIPRQDFLTQDQLYDGEHMVFNPWNCLPEHRPLGSVNRMRLAVYLASRQARRKLNMVAY